MSWTPRLELGDRDGAVYLRIAGAIQADVRAGVLRRGDRLPGTRAVAKSLGVHRNTVLAAWEELEAQGWIGTRPSSGTFVTADLPPLLEAAPTPKSEAAGFDVEPPAFVPTYGDSADGALGLLAGKPDLRLWRGFVDRRRNAPREVSIAIVAKYTGMNDTYLSVLRALEHAANSVGYRFRPDFVDSTALDNPTKSAAHQRRADIAMDILSNANGILVPGGFGTRGVEGKLTAIRFARESKKPFLGICLGMQMAVIEAARNVAGLKTAGSEEFDHESGKKRFEPVVYHLKEWVQGNYTVTRAVGDDKGGTMRLGAYDATLKDKSRVAEIYGSTTIEERHRHRYEVDIKYREKLEEAGLCFSGMSPDGRLPEIVEWSDHPWFIGVQFHPELKSKPFEPHPLFADFVRAAKESSRLV